MLVCWDTGRIHGYRRRHHKSRTIGTTSAREMRALSRTRVTLLLKTPLRLKTPPLLTPLRLKHPLGLMTMETLKLLLLMLLLQRLLRFLLI